MQLAAENHSTSTQEYGHNPTEDHSKHLTNSFSLHSHLHM